MRKNLKRNTLRILSTAAVMEALRLLPVYDNKQEGKWDAL